MQGPRPMTGRIVHAERVAETLPAPAGQPQPTVQRTRVTVLGADGLRQFVLEEADSIQVTDPDLRARIGQALEFAAPRGEPEPAPRHAAQHRRRPSHGARRLCRRGAAVEGVVSAGAAGEGRRSRAPAGLGGAGEPVGRRLGRRRADAAVRQSGHVPAGDLPELLRAAARGAGGDPRPHTAERRHARAAGGTGDAEGRRRTGRRSRRMRRAGTAAVAPAQRGAMAQPADQVQAAEGAEETIFQLPTPVVARRRPHRQRADHRSQHSGRTRGSRRRQRPASAVGDPHHQRHRRVDARRRADAVRRLRRRDLRRRRQARRAAGRRAPAAVVRPGPAHHGRAQQHRRDDAGLAHRRRRACCTSPRGSARCCG